MGVLEGKIKFHGSVGEEKDCTLDVENMPTPGPEIPEERGVYALVVDPTHVEGSPLYGDIQEYLKSEEDQENLEMAADLKANFPTTNGTYVLVVNGNNITYAKLPDLPTTANRYALRVSQTGELSWEELDEN